MMDGRDFINALPFDSCGSRCAPASPLFLQCPIGVGPPTLPGQISTFPLSFQLVVSSL